VRRHALVIELTGQMLVNSNQAMDTLLDKFSISHIVSRTPCPHVAVESEFDILDMSSFQNALGLALRDVSKVTIRAIGLGVFVSRTPVIHIRWLLDKELKKFRRKILASLLELQTQGDVAKHAEEVGWLPKTTLAYRDTSYENLSEVITSIKEIQFFGSMIVSHVSLYQYSVRDGEKRLFNIKLL